MLLKGNGKWVLQWSIACPLESMLNDYVHDTRFEDDKKKVSMLSVENFHYRLHWVSVAAMQRTKQRQSYRKIKKTSSVVLAGWFCLALLLHSLRKYHLCFQGRLSETNSWLNASVNQSAPLELSLVYSSLNIKMKQNSIRTDPQRSAIFRVDMEATLCSHRWLRGVGSSLMPPALTLWVSAGREAGFSLESCGGSTGGAGPGAFLAGAVLLLDSPV